MAEGLTATSHGPEIHLTGSVNAALAYMQHIQRAFAEMDSLEVCQEVLGSPPHCYTVTADDLMEEMWEENPIEEIEAIPPSAIDIWISADDLRILRVFVGPLPLPDEETGLFAHSMDFRYSDFNAVVITPPMDFVARDD